MLYVLGYANPLWGHRPMSIELVNLLRNAFRRSLHPTYDYDYDWGVLLRRQR